MRPAPDLSNCDPLNGQFWHGGLANHLLPASRCVMFWFGDSRRVHISIRRMRPERSGLSPRSIGGPVRDAIINEVWRNTA